MHNSVYKPLLVSGLPAIAQPKPGRQVIRLKPHELPSVGCRAVRLLLLAHMASFVGNPTNKRFETATAFTGGR